MKSSRILILETRGAGRFLGKLRQYLDSRGLKYHVGGRRGYGYDLLIVPGSSDRVAKDDHRRISHVIRTFVQKGLPVLGICYGSQIMWSMMGGRVVPRPFRQGIEKVDGIGHVQVAFHDTLVRHRDMPRHRVFARRGNSLRGFAWGPHMTGVLFHPEATPDGHAWLDTYFSRHRRRNPNGTFA
jgi:GMP synthase-like glutamine amidotransferase